LRILPVVRRLSHEADVPDARSLRSIQDDGGNTRRAFVGRTAKDTPRFEQRLRGGIGAAARDPYRSGVRSARQERPQRYHPFHATALGYTEERFRIRAPPLMGLRPAKQEQ